MKRAQPLKAGHSKGIYFLTDALGSVRDIVSGTDGAVLQSYDYTENGEKSASTSLKSDKTWVGGLSVNDDVGDSGLYLMGHRHYDSSLGRFLSRDPIGFAGGLNLYSYAESSPVTAVDPLGLEVITDFVVGTGETILGTFIAAEPTPAGELLMADGVRRIRRGLLGLGVLAAASTSGGDQPRVDTRDRRPRKNDIFFERFGSKEEAMASDAADMLLQKPCHEDEKWIAEVGKQNWKNLGDPKYHDWKMTIRARPSARVWLKLNAYTKPNEPWAYGIPAGGLDTFNMMFVKEITASSARKPNGRYNK
jgi:RHS repeat-associated protein